VSIIAVANVFHMAIYHKMWARDRPLAMWLVNSFAIEKRFGRYRSSNDSADPELLA
jgi:hypothetical protein